MLFPFGILQTTKPDSFLIIPGFPSPRPVFEYTLNFLSVFYVIKNTENMKPFANYFTKTKQNHVIVWTVDTINPDFQADSMKPSFSTIKKKKKRIFFQQLGHLNQLHLYLLIINFIHLLYMQMMMEVLCFFIKEVLDEEGVVSIINPLEGNLKKISIEVECDKKRRRFQYNLIQIK